MIKSFAEYSPARQLQIYAHARTTGRPSEGENLSQLKIFTKRCKIEIREQLKNRAAAVAAARKSRNR